jgi:hypothetical protein
MSKPDKEPDGELHPVARRHLTEYVEWLNDRQAKLEKQLHRNKGSEVLWKIAGGIDELHEFRIQAMKRLGIKSEKSEKEPGTKMLIALRKKWMKEKPKK